MAGRWARGTRLHKCPSVATARHDYGETLTKVFTSEEKEASSECVSMCTNGSVSVKERDGPWASSCMPQCAHL